MGSGGSRSTKTKATCPVIAKLGHRADLQRPGSVWTTLATAQRTWSRPKVGKRSESSLDTRCHQIITGINCFKSEFTSNQLIKMPHIDGFSPPPVLSPLPAYLGEREEVKMAEVLYIPTFHGAQWNPATLSSPYKAVPRRGHTPVSTVA